LAFAISVNYDRKLGYKLKHTFTIVNYDPKPFIVQATGKCATVVSYGRKLFVSLATGVRRTSCEAADATRPIRHLRPCVAQTRLRYRREDRPGVNPIQLVSLSLTRVVAK
jgi:hypothetical protein